MRFAPCEECRKPIVSEGNPKRIKREIARLVRSSDAPKKALDAAKESMKAAGEQARQEARKHARKQRAQEYIDKRMKKKEKCRGR
ncbi:MAG: DUF2992 family protein [Candidatus Ozemobacteraceae bacterium]